MARHNHHNSRPQRSKRERLPKEEGLSVNVTDGNIEKAIRRLKRKVENAGVLKELRERQYYTKPSEKRKLAKKAARNRWLKQKARIDNL